MTLNTPNFRILTDRLYITFNCSHFDHGKKAFGYRIVMTIPRRFTDGASLCAYMNAK